MADKKLLAELPVIEITIPLPKGELPEGRVLAAMASPLRNAEKEFATGIIVTAAVRNGTWCSVSSDTFGELLGQSPARFMAQGVINALYAMADEDYLELVTVGDIDYVVPKQKLAELIPNCRLGYY